MPAEVVSEEVVVALIKVPVSVAWVTRFFVGVKHEVQTFDQAVFKADYRGAYWCDIEWHTIVSADVHELVVQDKERVSKRTIPKVSVDLLPVPVGGGHFINYYYKRINRLT